MSFHQFIFLPQPISWPNLEVTRQTFNRIMYPQSASRKNYVYSISQHTVDQPQQYFEPTTHTGSVFANPSSASVHCDPSHNFDYVSIPSSRFKLWDTGSSKNEGENVSSLAKETNKEEAAALKLNSGLATGPSVPLRKYSSVLDLGIMRAKELSRSMKMAAEDELRYEALKFAHSTTAHGIPMVGVLRF